jgi:sugar O-acyltransferase (sialic acid O-acetyltransferase NeuD family)
MLIIGAKGFAKEVLQVLLRNGMEETIAFFDDINLESGNTLFNKYSVLRSDEDVLSYFKINNKKYTIGVGIPLIRHKMFKKFQKLEGELTSTISNNSNIGTYNVSIGYGVIVLDYANISNEVKIGDGSMIYYNSCITHDCIIGEFVEISPGVNILGRVKIGSFTQLGANSTILPDVTIGSNVIVGAGSVITKDVPDNCVVVGIPGKVIKKLEPINLNND